jgi:hypothetical protein
MNTELNALKDLVLTIIKKQEKPETLTLLSLEAARLPDAIIAHTLVLSTDKQVQNYISWQQEQLTCPGASYKKASSISSTS